MTAPKETAKPALVASSGARAASAPVSAAAPAAKPAPAAEPKPKPAPEPAAKPKPAPDAAPKAAPAPEKPAADKPAPKAYRPRPAAKPARVQLRHVMLVLSFLAFVVAPVAASAWYLWTRAADQYASYIGFSVRSESGSSPAELLGGLAAISSNSSTDTDMLYKYIQSHDIVSRVNERLDLRAMWSRPNEIDPVFGYRGDGSLEDLLRNWERMVSVYFDTGMLDLRVKAFDPDDAHAIASAIVDESTRRVNELSDVARADAIRYAQRELDDAVERLRGARAAVTEFRNRHQIVDPTADLAGQAGVIASLQQQLAEALIQQGLMRQNAGPNDPRLEQARLRVQVIQSQIEEERQKIGNETSGDGQLLSDVVGQYEVLSVDRAFAEQTYVAALAAFDTARAEAARQSRYLATYLTPTHPQSAEYPQRIKLIGLITGFLLVVWLIGVLVFYSVRDRR
ncbi:MAG: hypothetical protein Q4F71_10035 [Paracoccus sp. (in: a-proteobacteria)]|nr:hypothetical protein [Paracoccus sp. (in: a-proteobacteria)]